MLYEVITWRSGSSSEAWENQTGAPPQTPPEGLDPPDLPDTSKEKGPSFEGPFSLETHGVEGAEPPRGSGQRPAWFSPQLQQRGDRGGGAVGDLADGGVEHVAGGGHHLVRGIDADSYNFV